MYVVQCTCQYVLLICMLSEGRITQMESIVAENNGTTEEGPTAQIQIQVVSRIIFNTSLFTVLECCLTLFS